MGLLSDPSLNTKSKLGSNLAKHSSKICLLFYVAGLAWFTALGHPDFNHSTYLSENALSPGLVYLEMKQDSSRLALNLYEELQREREEHPSTTPHAWIAAKMRKIGLETHVHNFTLRYPFAGGKEFQGKNVYGILRAPRISSTEGIILSVPYRPATSVHTNIAASVPILLAFADFARRKNYWAKDMIFLVTEQEQLGMHAWLEAYYEGGIQGSSILQCGNLPARAGALQAALNLEVQDFDMDFIDVKIEGLNGQLPNLDMFNLVQRITSREGVSSGYKHTAQKKRRSPRPSLENNLLHMISMLLSQTTGVPNGNHGLYHRYRIESVTLEAVKRSNSESSISQKNNAALALLKVIEGTFRSLNNLLERFHQSYFFYILVQNESFVSIGDYMPCLGLLVAPIFIKAFLLWMNIGDKHGDTQEEKHSATEKFSKLEKEMQRDLPYMNIFTLIGLCCGLGALSYLLPFNAFVLEQFLNFGIGTSSMVSILISTVAIFAFVLPFFIKLTSEGQQLLHIAAHLSLAVILVVMGLLNFALSFVVAVVAVPLVILLPENFSKCTKLRINVVRFYALILNPLILIYAVVLLMTRHQFDELGLKAVLGRALTATMDAITFALMDWIIYGNWFYTAVTAAFFPLWTVFWVLAVTPLSRDDPKPKND